jgi:hypothetical protein
MANTVAAIAAFPDVVRGFTEPETSWTGSSQTMVANSAISAIHIYHCIAFKLSTSDIVHHLIFVSILCGLGIAFKDKGGIANNFGCFFLSGLPGAYHNQPHSLDRVRSFRHARSLTRTSAGVALSFADL